jgi:Fe-Mn family superoxide dismutase
MQKILFAVLAVALIGSTALYAADQKAVTKTPPKVETPATAQAKPFSVPALPYAYNALSPVIDTETMQLHHDKHHQAYVDKLNDAIAKDTGLQGLTIEEILGNVSNYEQVVRDNAGGHYNHSLYWRLMAPAGKGGQPSPELLAQINKDFGSLDKLKTAFNEAGGKRFGSGWVWLVWTGDKLVIGSTPNQDNPLMDDVELSGKPILANDVWEHAYYLTYRNKRPDYLKAWWTVVNWNEANALFAAARK